MDASGEQLDIPAGSQPAGQVGARLPGAPSSGWKVWALWLNASLQVYVGGGGGRGADCHVDLHPRLLSGRRVQGKGNLFFQPLLRQGKQARSQVDGVRARPGQQDREFLPGSRPSFWSPFYKGETWVRSLGWDDSPGEGSSSPPQSSGLENSVHREADRLPSMGSQSWTRLALSLFIKSKWRVRTSVTPQPGRPTPGTLLQSGCAGQELRSPFRGAVPAGCACGAPRATTGRGCRSWRSGAWPRRP